MKIKKLTLILSLFVLTACGNPISSSSFNSSSSNESTIPLVPTVVSESSSSNSTSSESSISSSSSEVSSSEQNSSSFESSSESSSEVSSSSEESLSSESSSTSTYTEPVPVTAYNNYYVNLLSWENGEDLKNQLHTIIRTGYNALSYDTPNWETNVYADHTKYDFEMLDIVYTATDISKNESGKGWQREHAFCASLMTGSSTGNAVKQKGRATDFHNLFASEASANGSRGNKNYGTADKSATNYTNRTVNNGQDGYSFAANKLWKSVALPL